jgi:predicted transcriptional regulator
MNLKQEVHYLNENSFMRVDDVARELGISKSYAYKIVQKLNAELREKEYLTISGRVNRQYFMEKLCYGGAERKES